MTLESIDFSTTMSSVEFPQGLLLEDDPRLLPEMVEENWEKVEMFPSFRNCNDDECKFFYANNEKSVSLFSTSDIGETVRKEISILHEPNHGGTLRFVSTRSSPIVPEEKVPQKNQARQLSTDYNTGDFVIPEEELASCRHSRERQTLRNFYKKLNELNLYKQKHGHTNVPQKFEDNLQLGFWVNKMRSAKKAYDRKKKSSLNERKIQLLNQIGFDWGRRKGEELWEKHFHSLVEYRDRHGNCDVLTRNHKPNSPLGRLGRFISTQRSEYKKYKRGEKTLLTTEQIERLNKIGFRWIMSSKRTSSKNRAC